MLKKELVCILCPNGCQLDITIEPEPELKVLSVEGCTCDKGAEYAEQEIINPMRTISSSILVEKGAFPLVSVRTDAPIPLDKIFDVMEKIKQGRARAPVAIGDILIENPADTACNIIATRNVPMAV